RISQAAGCRIETGKPVRCLQDVPTARVVRFDTSPAGLADAVVALENLTNRWRQARESGDTTILQLARSPGFVAPRVRAGSPADRDHGPRRLRCGLADRASLQRLQRLSVDPRDGSVRRRAYEPSAHRRGGDARGAVPSYTAGRGDRATRHPL